MSPGQTPVSPSSDVGSHHSQPPTPCLTPRSLPNQVSQRVLVAHMWCANNCVCLYVLSYYYAVYVLVYMYICFYSQFSVQAEILLSDILLF